MKDPSFFLAVHRMGIFQIFIITGDPLKAAYRVGFLLVKILQEKRSIEPFPFLYYSNIHQILKGSFK